jgi:hypothetical protein
MRGILWAIPIWGQKYVERWLRYGLPSMLAPGNLPALRDRFPVDVVLFTDEQSAPALKAACPFKVYTVPIEYGRSQKYGPMIRSHNQALVWAWREDLGIIFGLADSFYADGTFAEVGRLVASGKRAVLTQGLNVIEEALPPLDPATRTRDLIRIAAPILHARSWQQIWMGGTFLAGRVATPGTMLFPLGDHGFIMRVFHVYPLFLYPERQVVSGLSIDSWHLLGAALSNPEASCGWLDDSDLGCFIDIASESDAMGREGELHALGIDYARRWVDDFAAPFNRWAARHKIWLHDGVDRRDWSHVERESDEIISAILTPSSQTAG